MNYPKLEVLLVLDYSNNRTFNCPEVFMQNRHVIELSPSGKTFETRQELLLDAMLASGLPVPFSCRRGACGSCKVKVVSGRYQDKQRDADTPAPSYPLAADEMLLCQSHACSDMRLEIPGWSLDAPSLAFHAQVHSKRELSADIVELVLQPAQPLEVRAGQYVRFRLDNGDSRCFSIANLPAQDQGQLVFHIRKVSGGVFTEGLLPTLQAGAVLKLEGPVGACTWQHEDQRPLVLFATGTGYAGIKPLLLTAMAHAAEVTLYWGGSSTADFYDRAFLEQASLEYPHFRWHPVLSAEARVQQVALGQAHRWADTQVYACGNATMISQAREQCLAAGVPPHRFVAEAFVASGALAPQLSTANTLHPELEKVGPRYSLDGMLAAREQSVRAVAAIASQLHVGMTTAQALEMAAQTLQAMGASHTWHPTYIRFGDDTVRTPRQGIDPDRVLRTTDIVVVDVGPVWDGYEGDYGDTFVFGQHELHHACVKALHAVFDETRLAWGRGLTGRELYDFAERSAQAKGWQLERNLAGHRVADFPHVLYGQDKLAEVEIVPSEVVWVLEIQLCHPTEPIGAFFEDILITFTDMDEQYANTQPHPR
ncbi:NAD(P)H dependent flavin oxidoreductase family protein [Pseudomonas putida]|uniref:NAD(P)H dependent flavin oxidoreductase family protein n=1 Tax=Pseudomonas putida TaxID=303 RepID=A0ABD7BL38_PSEPU|nr:MULTISPECIES: NAD(P)H dependent flavin oxidoreductase family protein [Pseudomonas]EKT4450000.1 NAD(P)H dependent flavin oxidoreductase family protein [Pseudomonas putida]MBH3448682.1 NAD(P)H dependent flavin oxidoreductase family protein [Pseudomonas putida]MDD2071807.1 NAD(P)H dependent flavin oxidoreductase family protein [Pseudomonas putida]QOD00144.1 NAD(P)H dependent flavin oxidoreductase family protein [Pseudomonas putida]HDS1741495.1 NAD(P)H dependent flavin oxidoreductase family pro